MWMYGNKCGGNSAKAIEEAKLNFTVEKMPLFVHHDTVQENGDDLDIQVENVKIPEFATYRRDTKTRLGIVKNVYKILQNTEAFSFMDSLIESSQLEYTYGGSIDGGRIIWLVGKIPMATFTVADQTHQAHVTMVNGHDGKTAISAYPTDSRGRHVFVMNGGFRVRHSAKMDKQVEEGMRIIQNVVGIFERYGEKLNKLAGVPLSGDMFKSFAESVSANFLKVDSPTITTEDINLYRVGKAEKKMAAHIELVYDLTRAFIEENKEVEILKNTAYNAFNAVNRWANYGQKYNGSTLKRNETRFLNLLSGKGRKIQSYALDRIIYLFGG